VTPDDRHFGLEPSICNIAGKQFILLTLILCLFFYVLCRREVNFFPLFAAALF
jgi:hypothetical protein